ncbi:hypothetical protein KMZ32_12830 [Phycicoccus sp. MAQZ13P-2]|uniref:hypothetical protein n=1 Tax=Phycicoccus mangrovi TaxID=2840470 RepID=UPI001C007D9D|nr:hypothetical protein [Phycicoccus mangrovi]MBT9256894.1 hypothetical protein [Phycicoccus mangrovi]MBT9274957.1 hypothetical protein [Phycicoccus mangrovi]
MRPRPRPLALGAVLATAAVALVAGGATPVGAAAAASPRGSVSGRVTALVADGFRDARTSTTLAVVPDGAPRGLVPLTGVTATDEHPLVGAHVTLRGTRTPSGALRTSDAALAAAGSASRTAALATPSGTGPRTYRVLAVSLRFADRPAEAPASPSTVSARLFSGSGSVKAYYADSTDGRWTVTGRAVGPYTVTRSNPSSCDFREWGQRALAAATAAKVDTSAYTNIMVVVPRQASCGWDGLAEVPGTWSWINQNSPSLLVTAHELGHNLGEHHASGYRCTTGTTNVTLGAPAGCSDPTGTALEYADPFSVMGNTNARLHTATARDHFELLPPTTVAAGEARTLRIVPSDSTSGLREVRVPRPDGTWLTAELRSTTGVFDTFTASDPAVRGVTFRIDRGPAHQTWLVDGKPSTSSFADAPVLPGGSVTDALSGARIDVVSVSRSGATLRIGSAVAAPDLVAAASGSTVSARWTAPSGVVSPQGYDVSLDDRPAERVTTTAWTGTARAGWHTLRVRAVSSGGVVQPAATVTVRVVASPFAGLRAR